MLGKLFKAAFAGVSSYSSAKRLKSEAESGDPHAQLALAMIYLDLDSGAYNPSQASFWCHKAALQGQAEAQLWLGHLYAMGHGVPKNYQEAMNWFGKAAAQGNSSAAEELVKLRAEVERGIS